MERRITNLEAGAKVHEERLDALEVSTTETNSTLKRILMVLEGMVPVIENVKVWKERLIGGGAILLLTGVSAKIGLIDGLLAIL